MKKLNYEQRNFNDRITGASKLFKLGDIPKYARNQYQIYDLYAYNPLFSANPIWRFLTQRCDIGTIEAIAKRKLKSSAGFANYCVNNKHVTVTEYVEECLGDYWVLETVAMLNFSELNKLLYVDTKGGRLRLSIY